MRIPFPLGFREDGKGKAAKGPPPSYGKGWSKGREEYGSSGAGSVKRKDLGLEIGIWICHGPWTNPAKPTKHTFAKERSSYK